MARQNHGPLSRAKGKLGGVVYQQYEGMQISREYQPVVKNPQTTKQTQNRAAFKLASQLLAQFKNVIVERLALTSIYTRKRRAIAVNRIMSVITKSDPDMPTTVVNDVINAINEASVSSLSAPAITTVSNAHSIVAEAGDSVIMTKADYNAQGDLMNLSTESYTSDGTAKTSTPSAGYKSSVLMAVAFHALSEQGRAIIENLNFSSSDLEYGVTINRGVASGDIEITNMSGNVIISA